MKPPSRRERFIAEVAAAARKRHAPRRQSPEQLNNLARALKADPLRGLRAAAQAPRCSARNRAGLPCKCPAMRGATKCSQHGGRREAGPEHRGNQTWVLSGKAHRGARMQRIRQEGREAWEELTPEERRIAADLARGDGFAAAEAALALRQGRHDGGRAWHAWVARQAAQ